MNENDIINMINRDKSQNTPLFGQETLNNIHNKIMDRLKGGGRNNAEQKVSSKQEIMEMVAKADYKLRDSVNTLANILIEINDRELALSILGEHILMMSELFKSFESIPEQKK